MKKLFLLVLFTFIMYSLLAMDAKEIVDRMEEVMDFDSATFSATMKNTDRLGETNISFDTYQKGNGDTLLIVTSGFDKGQKVLRLNDEIYIFYPEAEEIIRLSSSGLKNAFLGSDFSYEDLTGDDDYDSRYSYELIGEKEYNDVLCYEVSFTAKKLSETYQKEILLIDKNLFVPLKASLYSRSGKLLKEIFYSDYIDSNGILFPASVSTQNAVKKSNKSEITLFDIVFDKKLDESLFDKEELAW